MQSYDAVGNRIATSQPQPDFLTAYDTFGNNSGTGGLLGMTGNPASNPLNLDNSQSSQVFKELQVQKLTVGGNKEITITPQNGIQQAMDDINTAGGGILRLSAGTYNVPGNLTGYSNIQIIGEDVTTTTLNFQSTSRNLTYTGTNIYTTGTITAISGGVNVTGSGTAWTSSMNGQNLFIGTRWYTIAVVSSVTSLVLAEAYGDNVALPSSYRIGVPITGVVIQDITFKNSTGTAVSLTDAKDIEFIRLTFISNNVGISFTNVSRVLANQIVVVTSTSDGSQLTNCGLFSISSWLGAGNGGNGFTLNNCKTIPFNFCAADSNTVDGFNISNNSDDIYMSVEVLSNGGHGINITT